MLNANDLYQYYYCPRKIYFMKTLQLNAPRRKMMYGKEEQAKEKKRVTERKDCFGIDASLIKSVMNNKYLEDEGTGLCGVVDVLLELNDGTYVPVEIKYTDYAEVNYARKKQLVAYALLVDKNFLVHTGRGILYFPKQNVEKTVNIREADKDSILYDLERIRALVASEKVPRQASSSKCDYCEHFKLCRSV